MLNQSSILIVDDDVNFRNTLFKIMKKKGYDVFTAENGHRAVELVRERTFDVILLDVKMPVMNGMEAWKLIKQIQPSATVIFITAFAVEELVKNAMEEGAYAMLSKPLDLDTVVSMVEKSKDGILITVVDDDPNLRKTMKTVLEKKGYSTTTCSTGEEAIALAKKSTPNLFFLDMKLPVLNGLEVYLEIKKVDPKAVVVLVTAYREEMGNLVEQALKAGAYACLHKPFEIDKAIQIIEEIIARKKK